MSLRNPPRLTARPRGMETERTMDSIKRGLMAWLMICIVLGPVQSQDASGGASGTDERSAAEGDMALADLLLEKGLITQEEWEGIRSKVERRSQASGEQSLHKTLERLTRDSHPPSADGAVDVSTSYKGLSVSSADGDSVFNFGGRLQLDGSTYSEGRSKLGNGTEVRRMRLRMSGTVERDWGYKLEVNFDPAGGSDITDSWIQYKGWEDVNAVVGHQKVPFGLQTMTSSNHQVFQERALPDAFIDGGSIGRRRMGVTATGWGDHHHVSAGLFGEGLDDDGKTNEDWGVAGRFVAAPLAEPEQHLAFGGSVYYRDLSPNSGLRFSSRPESHISGTKLVDTGVIAGADNITMANAEATLVSGRFHAQGEVFDVRVHRRGMGSASFGGYYGQVSWFLTEDNRSYSLKGAKYGRIKPKGEQGAVELAARYSMIDVSSRDVRGGRQEDVTLGLNWWMNPSMSMRFNYVYIHALETAQSLGLKSASEHAGAFQVRLQLVF